MILNMTGGGSTGCTLTVTAPTGAVVTASRDGRTLTKAAASGTAVFRGLESGEWVLTMTDGEQTSVPQIVTVKNDYEAELTFFAATINVTYPEGSVCTASDGVTTLTAPDTSGVWACTVPNAAVWTVSCEKDGDSDSKAVDITSDGQTADMELSYWNGELYDAGNPFVEKTGGWSSSGYKNTGFGCASSINSDSITLRSIAGSALGGVGTVNKVDMSAYSTLKAIVTSNSGDEMLFKILASKSDDVKNGSSIAAKTISAGSKVTASISIAGISSGYVVLAASYGGAIYKVWME